MEKYRFVDKKSNFEYDSNATFKFVCDKLQMIRPIQMAIKHNAKIFNTMFRFECFSIAGYMNLKGRFLLDRMKDKKASLFYIQGKFISIQPFLYIR